MIFAKMKSFFANFAKFSIFVATQKDTPLPLLPRFAEKNIHRFRGPTVQLYLLLYSISTMQLYSVQRIVYKQAQKPHMMHQASKNVSVDDYEDVMAGVVIKI